MHIEEPRWNAEILYGFLDPGSLSSWDPATFLYFISVEQPLWC